MKTLIGAVLFGACVLTANAQDELVRLKMQTRVDYQREYIDGKAIHDNSGFKGKYLMLSIDGKIDKHFSYAYRQRLNVGHSDMSFFDATDWAKLVYSPDGHLEFAAGKDVVAVGGYEYDKNPVDVYAASEYWNNISPFQLAATVSYTTPDGRNKLMAQCSQSIYRSNAPDMYSYNLMWVGNNGCLGTMYSANLVEYMPGKYISYLALGHKLTLGRLCLEADFMNRASSGHTFLFKDCSIMAELAYRPIDKLNVLGKVTYDVNRTGKAADCSVFDGTELTSVSGGVEFYPLSNIRLHAMYAYTFGKNSNQDGTMKPGRDFMSIGLMWNVNLLKLKNPWKKDDN